MTNGSPSSFPLVYVFTFATGGAAWLATQFASFLVMVRTLLAFAVGSEVAEFLARPYVFPGVCMVVAAIIPQAVKLLMWYADRPLKRERDALLQELQSLKEG